MTLEPSRGASSSAGAAAADGALTAATPRRGRPRDKDIDQRILRAASEVYRERGWAGFSIESIARRSGVSRDAVYRRFDDNISLLMASMSAATRHRRHQDALEPQPSVRDYLLAIARDYFEGYTGDPGFDYLRIYVESRHTPSLLRAFHVEQSGPTTSAVRRLVRDAISEGRLPLADSPTAIIDAVIGGVAMHVMVTPPALYERMLSGADVFLQDLVDLVLRGCGYQEPTSRPTYGPATNNDRE